MFGVDRFQAVEHLFGQAPSFYLERMRRLRVGAVESMFSKSVHADGRKVLDERPPLATASS